MKQLLSLGTIYRWRNHCWENEVTPKATQLVVGSGKWSLVFLCPEACSEVLFTSFSAHNNHVEVLLKLLSPIYRDSGSDPEGLEWGSAFCTLKSISSPGDSNEVVCRPHFRKHWYPCSFLLVLRDLLHILKLMATYDLCMPPSCHIPIKRWNFFLYPLESSRPCVCFD